MTVTIQTWCTEHFLNPGGQFSNSTKNVFLFIIKILELFTAESTYSTMVDPGLRNMTMISKTINPADLITGVYTSLNNFVNASDSGELIFLYASIKLVLVR